MNLEAMKDRSLRLALGFISEIEKPSKSLQMIGIFWNCRGVAKKGLSSFIKELIWDHKADFMGLQETMKKSYTDKFF